MAPRTYRLRLKKKSKGYLIIFTGKGKGKTAAAYGVALRTLGLGHKVAIVQFIKGPWVSNEVKAMKTFGNQVDMYTAGDGFTWQTKDRKKETASALKGWAVCLGLLSAGRHQLYIFDEIIYALKYGFLSVSEVRKGLRARPPLVHIILTGRDVPAELVKIADMVTEMKDIKHPFRKGWLAQAGIDF